jgi:ADP-ribosyl-[dinitrogen reductase] hydrolase
VNVEVAALADRIAGTLVASAVGDALGAGYEFGSAPLPDDGRAAMIGGGLGDFAPGEWTDDTAMGIGVAEVTARHGATDLYAIGERFLDWFHSGPPDVGNATRAVLSRAADPGQLVTVAADHFERNPRGGAGNGALMRTGAVALAYLGDDTLLASAARDVAKLTHADPLAADSCVLWCIAIDRAVREQRLDGVYDGLDHVTPANRTRWAAALSAAADGPPERFSPNGFTVTALQAAVSAIWTTPVPEVAPASHLVDALHAAVRIGDDTDTIAAIAGMLLGARWGAGAVPAAWRRAVHGWPGADAVELGRLALRTASHGHGAAIGGTDDPDDAHFEQAVAAIRVTDGS